MVFTTILFNNNFISVNHIQKINKYEYDIYAGFIPDDYSRVIAVNYIVK